MLEVTSFLLVNFVWTFALKNCILLPGMSTRAQMDVLKKFKQGKSRLLIATSVAEEGLDIRACNCVFRYNYTTNEIGRVQAKGRLLKRPFGQNEIWNCSSRN